MLRFTQPIYDHFMRLFPNTREQKKNNQKDNFIHKKLIY